MQLSIHSKFCVGSEWSHSFWLQDLHYNCMKLSLWTILSESTQCWHRENCLEKPAANVMSSAFFKKNPTPIITDSSSHQHQDVSDYIVWLWGKRTRTRLKGRGCHCEVRGSPLRLQLQTATLHADSWAKVFPNDGWKAFIKQNMNPGAYCSWQELRKGTVGVGCNFLCLW